MATSRFVENTPPCYLYFAVLCTVQPKLVVPFVRLQVVNGLLHAMGNDKYATIFFKSILLVYISVWMCKYPIQMVQVHTHVVKLCKDAELMFDRALVWLGLVTVSCLLSYPSSQPELNSPP
jgi:hypothetical protein